MKIDSITPDSALPGTPVLIKGDGLDTADTLLFGDEPVPFKVSGTGEDVPSPVELWRRPGDHQAASTC